MKILVVCQYYYPEPFRIHEVCEELVNRGHSVTVLTGLPNYPMGVIPDEYKNGGHRDEYVNGVRVIRVEEIPRTKGKVGLAKNYVSFVVSGSLKALTLEKDYDAIFVYQLSPILMAIPAYVAKWTMRKRKLSIYCLDLWPESLSSLGISKDSVFYKFMKWVSIRIYKGAYSVSYTSKMFKSYFENELGLKNMKTVHIPQFADELFSKVGGKDTKDDEHINYVFAGNVGEMVSVDTIIKAAALVKDERIRWHIVGDGSALDDCKKLSKENHTEDVVTFYGRLPVEEMPRFYEMADAMILTLSDNEMISYTLPGKIQSYMAAGKAVIAAAGGEAANVIKSSECGMCAHAEDALGLALIAEQMANSDLKTMGANARKYYEENFGRKSHVDLIEKQLLRTAKAGRRR